MTNYKFIGFMRKITQLLKHNLKWLYTKPLILTIFCVFLSLLNGYAQTYCTPTYSSNCAGSGDDLNSFVITGYGTSVISDLDTGCTGPYLDNTAVFTPVDLYPGQSFPVEINTTYGSGSEYASIWIDFDNDGIFDSSEKLLTDLSLVQNPAFSTASISIPLMASSGIRRMRVRVVYNGSGFGPCAQESWGEAHDYSVNILPLPACSGMPSAGTASVTVRSCPDSPFTLSVTGTTAASDLTFQWQSSPQGAGTFTDILGATSMSYTVTSQTVSTDYRFVITCNNGGSSDISNVVTVIQSMGFINIIENFDSTSTGSSSNPTIPLCWNYIDDVATTGYGYTIAETPQSKPNAFRLHRTNSTSNSNEDLVLVSPLTIDLGNGTKQLRFSARSYATTTYANKLEVLSMKTPNSTVGATVLATFYPDQKNYQEYIVLLPATTDDYFGFRLAHNGSTTTSSILIDNINYEDLFTCYYPINATITKASSTSVDVLIDPSPFNTAGVTYEYEVRTSGAPGSGVAGFVSTGTSTTINFTVGNLSEGIYYTIYVRTICGPTNQSSFRSYEFSIPSQLPYTQNFEGIQNGWYLSNGSSVNEWIVGDAISNSGLQSLYISNDQGWSNSYSTSTSTVVHAYKDFVVPANSTEISLSFDWRALAESCCDYIRVWLVPSTFVPIPGEQISAVTNSRVDLFGNLNQDSTFKRAQKIQNISNYTDSFRVVFEWRNDGSGGTSPAGAIDDIEIKRATCYQPVSMALSNITEKGVSVTVTPQAKNTGTVSYQYEVRTSGAPGSGSVGRVAIGTSSTVAFNIIGLPPNTNYKIYIRTACSSTDSSFWISDSFKTLETLTIDAIKEDVSCFGSDNGSITITTKGGKLPYTYLWTPTAATTSSISNLGPGVYDLKVEDASGQVINRSVTIIEPTIVVSGLDYTDVICNGQNNGVASVAPSGGVPPYTVLWSDNTIGLTNSSLAPGNYSVTIRDANSCVLTENFTINEPNLLVTSAGNQTNVSVYGGNDGSATVNVTGGVSPYAFTWTPSVSTTNTASSLIAGTYKVLVTDVNGCTSTQIFVITEPAPPYVVSLVSQTNVSCNGKNDGAITINAIGPNAPFTYSWSPVGGNGTTASNLPAGTYTVTVTDAINEIVTKDFVITEPNIMSASVGSIINVNCNGGNSGSATASVFGGTLPYNYVWSNGESSVTASNLSGGNHFVLVTDANGCQVQEFFNIGQPSAILINTLSLTNVSCNGQADGAITVSVNGGLPPYTYSWNNNQTGPSLSNISGGNYTVTVTDSNGCTALKSFTINDPALVYAPVAVNQGFCTNAILSDINITGVNIKWYDAMVNGNVLPSTTVLTNGNTYYASQTVNGCESSSRTPVQVTLYQPVPLTTTSINICHNTIIQDVTIDGNAYTQLRWYNNATSTSVLSSNHLLTTGTYYVSTYTNGVCESVKYPVQVNVLAIVPAPVVGAQIVCGYKTFNDINITKVPGGTINWYTSAQSNNPLVGSDQILSGTYYVDQIVGSCKSTRVAVPVQVIPVTSPNITDVTVCDGTTIGDFNNDVAPIKYVWYVDDNTTTALTDTYLIKAGSYYIAEEVSGCISNRTKVDVVVNARPSNPTGQLIQTFGSKNVVADLKMNQTGVEWYGSINDALSLTNRLANNKLLENDVTYYGIIRGTNNCPSYPTGVKVIIDLSNSELDLTHLKYYPNPIDSELNIEYNEVIKKVEVYTITGQKILSKEFDSEQIKVDLSNCSSGTYMVRIETDKASQFIKIVKK